MELHTDFMLSPDGWWFTLAAITTAVVGSLWTLYQESKRND